MHISILEKKNKQTNKKQKTKNKQKKQIIYCQRSKVVRFKAQYYTMISRKYNLRLSKKKKIKQQQRFIDCTISDLSCTKIDSPFLVPCCWIFFAISEPGTTIVCPQIHLNISQFGGATMEREQLGHCKRDVFGTSDNFATISNEQDEQLKNVLPSWFNKNKK